MRSVMNFFHIPPIIRYFSGPFLTWSVAEKGKNIYLTFDDGPHPDATNIILDILKESGIKATFFCVGENTIRFPEVYNSIIGQGHQTANHTFNHLKGWKASKSEYIENVEKCNSVINSELFRPPYGRIKRSQARELSKKYKIIMWSILAGDYDRSSSPDDCLKRLKRHTKPGAIIVLHDNIKTIEKVKQILPAYISYCKSKGYTFEVIKPELIQNQ